MAAEATDPEFIGTVEAAKRLHWHPRKVQRVLKRLETSEIPVIVNRGGGRGEYVVRADALDAIADAAAHH